MNRRFFFAIALSLSVLACKGKDEDSGSADDSEPGTTDQTGGELYAGNCAGCHASDGSGSVGPSLVQQIPGLDDDALMDVLNNGIGDMDPPVLNDAEEDVLFDWLRVEFGNYGGT